VFVKNLVFVLSAMLAGAAGAFSGHLTRIVTPDAYGFTQAVDILAYAVLGGTGAWFGPIIGGMIMGALPEMMRVANEYRGFLVGLVLWAVIVFLPGGIIGVPRMIANLFNRDKPTDDPIVTPRTPEKEGS
jgi:branched-chain amino acid transport system permease protein